MALITIIFHEDRIFPIDVSVLTGVFIGERERKKFLHSYLQNKAGKVPLPLDGINLNFGGSLCSDQSRSKAFHPNSFWVSYVPDYCTIKDNLCFRT